jgi:hypothetical protein
MGQVEPTVQERIHLDRQHIASKKEEEVVGDRRPIASG